MVVNVFVACQVKLCRTCGKMDMAGQLATCKLLRLVQARQEKCENTDGDVEDFSNLDRRLTGSLCVFWPFLIDVPSCLSLQSMRWPVLASVFLPLLRHLTSMVRKSSCDCACAQASGPVAGARLHELYWMNRDNIVYSSRWAFSYIEWRNVITRT